MFSATAIVHLSTKLIRHSRSNFRRPRMGGTFGRQIIATVTTNRGQRGALYGDSGPGGAGHGGCGGDPANENANVRFYDDDVGGCGEGGVGGGSGCGDGDGEEPLLLLQLEQDETENDNNNNKWLKNGNNDVFDPSRIKVNVNAYIEDKPTMIEEASNIFVKYKTPSFKAEAAVLVPRMKSSESWKIGWVQACHRMKFVNIYGNLGMTSWEFPELNRGLKMLSDSDGIHFPWYGNRHEVQLVSGPTKGSTTFNIRMSDSFSPQITWVPPNGDRFVAGECKLTEIHRDQSFHSWVVARNEETKQVFPLKTVIWRMQINIAVDPDRALGQRSTLMGPIKQIQPEVLPYNEPIPPNALDPPHANAAQMLLWRPYHGRVGVVIAPKWSGAPPLTEKDIQNPFL